MAIRVPSEGGQKYLTWSVPQEWKGERVFILGGGPSLKGFNAETLRDQGRVIAVNNAGLILTPWADVMFWADRRWLEWNSDRLHLHTGQYKITRKAPHIPLDPSLDIKVLKFQSSLILSDNPAIVAGWCGGSSAINLAALFGSREIYLLGFDMRPGNFHNEHLQPALPNQHAQKFIPNLNTMAPRLRSRGIKVTNLTPGSALKCFPFGRLEDIIS